MNTIFVLYGIPASGKDFWAREMVKNANGRIKRVNKDDLRAMLHVSGGFSAESEKFVLNIRDKIVEKSLRDGHDIIVSDTNFPFGGKHFLRMCEIAQLVGDVQVIEKYFDISLKDAIARNSNADRNPVPVEVIENMFNRHVKGRPYTCGTYYFGPLQPMVQDESLPHAVIFDVDGTLAIMGDRSAYDWKRVGVDTVNEPVRQLLCSVKHDGKKVIIVSGRDGQCEVETKEWLLMNDIEYDEFYMRKANDMRKDNVIKKEIFDKHIFGKYYIEYLVDDRLQVVQQYRSMGLTVLQCDVGDF